MSDVRCKTCGEPLLFVENVATGAKLPLVRAPMRVPDRESLHPGMVVVSPSLRKGRVLTLDLIEREAERILEAADEGLLRTTHFASERCKREWSGRSRAAASVGP